MFYKVIKIISCVVTMVLVVGSQLPKSWHSSAGAHTSTLPAQTPSWHVADEVQGPGSHGIPWLIGEVEQVPVPG